MPSGLPDVPDVIGGYRDPGGTEFDRMIVSVNALNQMVAGHSGFMRALDYGLVTALGLMADGPRLLFTPVGTELVTLYLRPGAALDNSWVISTLADDAASDGSTPDDVTKFTSAATKLVLKGNSLLVLSAVGDWQAAHDYALGDAILDGAGHIQIISTAGTSDTPDPPTFDDLGSTTVDGTATWTDGGLAPTHGSVQALALVVKPQPA